MSEEDDNNKNRNELARMRTEAAHRRTQLANERTFSAWVRTGLALVVTGFAAARLLDETGPAWLLTTVGILLVALGGLSFLIAHRSYRKARAPEAAGLSHLVTGTIVALLALVCAAGVFLILNASSGWLKV